MARKIAHKPNFNNYTFVLDNEKVSVINNNTKLEVKTNPGQTASWTLFGDHGGKNTFREKDILALFNNMAENAANPNTMANKTKGSAASRSKKQGAQAPAADPTGTAGVGTGAQAPSPVPEAEAGAGAPAAQGAKEPEKTAEQKQAEKDAAKAQADAKKKADKDAADAELAKSSAEILAKLKTMPLTTKDEIRAAANELKGKKLTKDDREEANGMLKIARKNVKPAPRAFVKNDGTERRVLSREDVINIRARLNLVKPDGTKLSIPEIAKEFGTLKRTIKGIRDGKRFTGVGLPEVGAAAPAAEATAATNGTGAAPAATPAAAEGQPVPEQAAK